MTGSEPEPIVIRGARAHNLKGVDLQVPNHGLTVFVGVSGSGKTSLLMDTLWVEGQRRFLRASGGSRLRRPDFDLLTGLPPTIGLHQRGAEPAGRRTVAEIAEIAEPLASVWAWSGEVRCPDCQRSLWTDTPTSAARRLHAEHPGARATVLAPLVRVGGAAGASTIALLEVARSLGFARVRLDGEVHHLDDVPAARARTALQVEVVVDRLRLDPDRMERTEEAFQVAFAAGAGRIAVQVEGAQGPVLEWYADRPLCPDHPRVWLQPEPRVFQADSITGACTACRGAGVVADARCERCNGERLGETGRHSFVGELRLPTLLAGTVQQAGAQIAALRRSTPPALTPLLDDVMSRLSVLQDLGLASVALNQRCRTLAAGELRRLMLAVATTPTLPGVLYLLDEPCAGLTPQDAARVRAHLGRMVDEGSPVLVVDHDLGLLKIADHIVEFGPGAGHAGGEIIFRGTAGALGQADTPTGRALRGLPAIAAASPQVRGVLGLTAAPLPRGPRRRFEVPMPGLSVIVGPSGSGKTNLLERTLGRALTRHLTQSGPTPLPFADSHGFDQVTRLLRLSRAPLGSSAQSCTATAAGIWSPLREALSQTREARMRGFGPARFSFNRSGGRCPTCLGTGRKHIRLDAGPPVDAPCPVCEGRRFEPDTLTIRIKGLSVADLLDLTVSEALLHFQAWPQIRAPLRALERAGLGYLTLGQATVSLSGGEAQRLRLARELARLQVVSASDTLLGTLLVLDEPAQGLHPLDAHHLATVLVDLVEGGATIICATAAPSLIGAADRVIDLS